jgi:hypothetical protein
MLALAIILPAAAYTPSAVEFNGQVVVQSWPAPSLPLRFRVNDRPLPQLLQFASNSTPGVAIEGAFKSWVGGTGIRIQNDGATSVLNGGADRLNLISFADTPQNRDFVGNALALTLVLFRPDRGDIIETDIVLNPRQKWATDGRRAVFDAEEALVHEMGHAVGLDHSGLLSSTMNPVGRPGSILARSLEADDLAGVRFLYPTLAARNTGILTGRVTTTDNRSVLGAHVVAVDSHGVAQVGATTLADGSFRLTSLPVGDYQLYAEPLDGPVTLRDVGEVFARGASVFRTTFAGGNTTPATFRVTAGQTTVVSPIKVESQAPTINPLFIGLVDAEGSAYLNVQSEAVRAGANEIILLAGRGLGAVPSDRIRATGGDIAFNTAGAERDAEGSIGFGFFPFHVASGAVPGPRSISFATATERAMLSGALEVLR